MLFLYEAIKKGGERTRGSIDAINEDIAINSLQRRGLILYSIKPAEEKSIFQFNITLFEHVSTKEIVILSRQISTLFEAQVSALKAFRMLASEVQKPLLARTLIEISDDIQGGSSMYKALEKHPKVFSQFYINMVRSGEESGNLDQTFTYLADYLDRSYEMMAKTRNALVYPAFIIFVFFGVMLFMFTTVVPSITGILKESGQEIPIYTRIVMGISDVLVNYGFLLLAGVVLGGIASWWYIYRTEGGASVFARLQISIPLIGDLYRKLYLARIADNMSTMLSSGIPMVKVIEITSSVVSNEVYEGILTESADAVRSGATVAETFSRFEEIPSILVQMIGIGEESGQLGKVLSTMSSFYRREVQNAIDTLIGMIEPAMIVLLGLGVLVLLVSVLVPIYNISSGF